jgi:hypothetical protein
MSQGFLSATCPFPQRTQRALYDYVDRIREDANARGLDPASRPEWSVVAGLRGLTNARYGRIGLVAMPYYLLLVEQVTQAQTEGTTRPPCDRSGHADRRRPCRRAALG